MEKETSHADHGSFFVCETGLISQYQSEDGSGQFTLLRLENNNGVAVDFLLSFCTDKYVKICASCNGLLLLSSIKDDQVCYHVFDPHDKECVTLPQPCVAARIIRTSIIFDGYHYQVMLLHAGTVTDDGEAVSDSSPGMDIFSSETERWTSHQLIGLYLPSPLPTFEFPELEILPLYSNGCVHWELCGHLLVYRVEDNSCELIELPNVSEDWFWQFTTSVRRCFWESEGHVNYTYTDFDGIHTWELLKEEDHNPFFEYDRNKFRWRLTHSIMHNELMWEYQDIISCLRGSIDDLSETCHVSPVAYIESTDSMYLQLPGALLSYNLKNKVLKKVCTYSLRGMDLYCCFFFPFAFAEQRKSVRETETTAASDEEVTLPLRDEELHHLSL